MGLGAGRSHCFPNACKPGGMLALQSDHVQSRDRKCCFLGILAGKETQKTE